MPSSGQLGHQARAGVRSFQPARRSIGKGPAVVVVARRAGARPPHGSGVRESRRTRPGAAPARAVPGDHLSVQDARIGTWKRSWASGGQKAPHAPAFRKPTSIARPIANCTRPTAAWRSMYQVGPAEGRIPVSSRTDAGSRKSPARKATRTRQNVQRQRRTTPMASSARRADSATRTRFRPAGCQPAALTHRQEPLAPQPRCSRGSATPEG